MSTVAQHLSGLLTQAAAAAGFEGAIDPVVPTRDASHGDYQSNAAFKLGKARGMAPRAAAEALKAHFPAHPSVTAVDVAGAGFLNLHLDHAWLAADVRDRARSPVFGARQKGVGRSVVIDYSSPNVAKRLHVGHLRSITIGDALARLHRAVGYRVVGDNHLGDWGTPVGKLLVAWEDWRDDAAYAADPVGELQRLYQKADAEMKSQPALLERARAATVGLQSGDAATLASWRQFVDVSMTELQAVYARLGVAFDTFHGESFYDARLAPMVAELLASGVAVESKGAVVIPLDEKGLEEQPLLIRKADGAALYGTTDLATIEFRTREYAPVEKVLYVVDTRQQLHFRQVFAGARKMGLTGTFVHVWFGMLKFEGGAIASTRAGDVINLVDLLDAAAGHAFDVVSARSAQLPEDERRRIAEVVGVGAVKYFDLAQNPQTDIVFSWDKALSLDAGSSVYVQYGYARLHSILRSGGADAGTDALPAHEHPAERALLRLVARLPEVVEAAADTHKPNLVAEHLESLVKGVGAFYEHCPVLKADVPPAVRESRLGLAWVVTRALAFGLDVLGIGVIPRL